MKFTLFTILLVTILLNAGCKDDIPDPILVTRTKTDNSREVLIANQGNFGWGEGTLSLYEADGKTIQNDVYKTINGESLGNVFQSINRVGSDFYFVINNAGKIVVTDSNFTKKQEITGLTSPRYLYEVLPGKAYVTDLYSKTISIINLTNNSITGTIATGTFTDKGALRDSIFWCTAPEANKIYGVNIYTDILVDSMDVGVRPEGIVVDKNNFVRVLCSGDVPILFSFVESAGKRYPTGYILRGVPTGLVYNKSQDKFYYCNAEGIYQASGPVNSGSSKLWQEAKGSVFYSIGLDPLNGEIYVADTKDFVSKSIVKRFSQEGELLDEFTAGIITGDFFFP